MCHYDQGFARRLTQQGETWSQAGEDFHKRLSSAQADAAAEALRAQVAHFMAAQQQTAGQPILSSGQPGPGSMPAVADLSPAAMAVGVSSLPAAAQQPHMLPQTSQLPSSVAGEPP